MTLFDQAPNKNEPLAARMRPRNLDEYIGQEQIVGKGRLLRRAIQADQLSSVIFYGPPGTGKTTLARVIAGTTKRHFSTLNAVLSGVKELREEIQAAKDRQDHYGTGTILFIDEVHRWNKSQQDALLPWVENGTVILIGATTENPFFEVNAALVSRSRIFQLKPLTDDDLFAIAKQALADKERGYGNYQVSFEKGALDHLVEVANGDARSLLNALQLSVETSVDKFPPPIGAPIFISRQAAEESIQRKVVLYDKEGDYHFDVISAFIKSIRGSDPDAALYWMAKMVAAGEDPRFIFRRMLISASEDIGMADPYAITVVESDAAAFDRIGLPEGRFHLTHAALYLSTAPKSNSALAFFDALKVVEEENAQSEVPNHLRDASRDAKGFGHGEGYLYPHSYKDHWVAQQYLPSELQGKVFYQPGNIGYEKKIHDSVLEKREEQIENAAIDTSVESLSYSPNDKSREMWVRRTMSERGTMLKAIRDRLYGQITPTRSDRILVLGGGFGMLLWPAWRLVPEGLVVCQVDSAEEKAYIEHYGDSLDSITRPTLFQGTTKGVFATLEEGLRFEEIVARNVLNRLDEGKELLALMKGRMEGRGVISLAQTIPGESSRLSSFVQDKDARALLEEREKELFSSSIAWKSDDLAALFREMGFKTEISYLDMEESRMVSEKNIRSWLSGGYKGCEKAEDALLALCKAPLGWRHHIAIIKAYLTPQKKAKRDDKSEKEWKQVEMKTKG